MSVYRVKGYVKKWEDALIVADSPEEAVEQFTKKRYWASEIEVRHVEDETDK